MISSENDLFEWAKIKFELEFINKNKNMERYENIKKLLKSNFSEFSIKSFGQDNQSDQQIIYKSKYFIHFFESQDNKNQILQLPSEVHCKLLICINEEDKQDKIISSYTNYLDNLKDQKKKKLEKLLFLADSNDVNKDKGQVSVDSPLRNIIYMQSEKSLGEEEFIFEMFKLINTNVKEFIKLYKEELDRLERDEISDKKSKNLIKLKTRSDFYLVLGEYKLAYQCFITVSEVAKVVGDNITQWRAREGMAVALFMEDLLRALQSDNNFNLKELKSNQEVESAFETAFSSYRKFKSSELAIDCYFRLAHYYSLFGNNKLRQFLETMKRIYDEAEGLPPMYKLHCLLRFKSLFESQKMKRKSTFFMYMALGICFENPELTNLLPFIFNDISENFYVSDIYNVKIENPEEFAEIHKKLIKSTWKKISFNTITNFEEKRDMKENNKKRIDKEFRLFVVNRLDSVKKVMLNPIWEPIQYNLYLNFVNFYKNVGELKMKLAYSMSYIQTLTNFISIYDQKSLTSSIMMDSSLLQEKIFLNLPKLPVLVKILPLPSDVKFDTAKGKGMIKLDNAESSQVNTHDNAASGVFLYNPWERDDSNSSGVNYYWTVGSYQKVYIQFYNPLSVELKVNKIVLLFEGSKPFSFPTSTVIQPNSTQGVVCKIRPTHNGLCNITGIKYEVFNTGSVQFVDWNGNGLFFGYDNYNKESSFALMNKREKISLRNIKIFPEIPQLEIKILDSSAKIINGSLDLFDYQYYNFCFLLENAGEHPIHEINVNIYAYKKDDYKIALDEIKLSTPFLIEKNKNYTLNYNYLHKKIFKKIEFKIYYISHTSNKGTSASDVIMKPYLYYQKPLNTLKLLNLSTLKVIPMLSNNMIHLITMTDPKINRDYSKFFCSDKYYVSFMIGNPHDDILTFDIYSRNSLIKKEVCEVKSTKEISLVIDSEMKMSEFTMNWEFSKLNNVRGKIDFSQIFKEFSFKFQNRVKFEIHSWEETNLQGIKYFSIEYKIKNNTDRHFKNLKFYIYLYQIYDDENIIFNNQLPDDFYYEGSLFHQMKELKEYDTLNFTLKLYPLENEHISTTCLVVDQNNHCIYMSPISKPFYLV